MRIEETTRTRGIKREEAEMMSKAEELELKTQMKELKYTNMRLNKLLRIALNEKDEAEKIVNKMRKKK